MTVVQQDELIRLCVDALVQVGETATSQPGSSEILSQKSFAAGLYIVEVFDYAFTSANAGVSHCMTVAVTGG